jgi:hypothetical protein
MDDLDLPEDKSDQELKDLIKDALKSNIEVKKKKVSKRQLTSALTGTLDEFLNNFILIGYDMEGSPIILRSHKTEMENEALKSLFIKYFTMYMYNYEDF